MSLTSISFHLTRSVQLWKLRKPKPSLSLELLYSLTVFYSWLHLTRHLKTFIVNHYPNRNKNKTGKPFFFFYSSHSRKGFHSLPDFLSHVLSSRPQDLSRSLAAAGRLSEEFLSKETLHFLILIRLPHAHGILLLQAHRSLWFIGWGFCSTYLVTKVSHYKIYMVIILGLYNKLTLITRTVWLHKSKTKLI